MLSSLFYINIVSKPTKVVFEIYCLIIIIKIEFANIEIILTNMKYDISRQKFNMSAEIK